MMYMLDNIKDSDIIHITSTSIQELGKNIKQFVNIYRSYIRIKDEKEMDILNTLDIFADKLLRKDYSGIFGENVIIDNIDNIHDMTIMDLEDDEIPF